MNTKPKPFTVDDLKDKTVKPVRKIAKPSAKRQHWSIEFFRHIDALGEELRKSKRTAGA